MNITTRFNRQRVLEAIHEAANARKSSAIKWLSAQPSRDYESGLAKMDDYEIENLLQQFGASSEQFELVEQEPEAERREESDLGHAFSSQPQVDRPAEYDSEVLMTDAEPPAHQLRATEATESLTLAQLRQRARESFNAQGIPEALKTKRCWLLWKVTKITDPVLGKYNKIPVYAVTLKNRSGTQGSKIDLDNLTTFDQAISAFTANESICGLGIAFIPGIGLTAYDGDKCVVDGKVAADAAEIVSGTYAEISPSGTGVHAIWEGSTKSAKNNATGHELFGDSGFLTITGNRINGNDTIRPLSSTKKALLEAICGTKAKAHTKANADRASETQEAAFVGISDDPFVSLLTEQQVADSRAVLVAMRAKGLHESEDAWHRVGAALAPYGDIGEELFIGFSEGAKNYKGEADCLKKLRDKRRNGATSIGHLFAIAAESGIDNPAKGRHRGATTDFPANSDPIWPFKPISMAKMMREPAKPIKWLFHQRMPGSRASLLTGVGGTSKTQLLYQMAIAAVLGRCPWGWQVDTSGKALLILTEDDENDPHSTLDAVKNAMFLSDEDRQRIEDNTIIFALAGKDLKLMIRDPNSKALVPSGYFNGLREHITAVGGVVFVGIDPALGVTEGDEASQADQRALGRMADNLAVQCDCAVVILTHGTKGSLQSEEITSHSSRGGGAITDAVRAEYGMRTMTPKEAVRFGIKDIAERESYVQLKATKGNRLPPDAKASIWLKRIRGGFLELANLEEVERGGMSPRARDALALLGEIDPDNIGMKKAAWQQSCEERGIIGGPNPDARKKAMDRTVKEIGERVRTEGRGIYVRNYVEFDPDADND